MKNKDHKIKTDPDLAFQQPDAIKAFQLECLKDHLQYCYDNSPYYHRLIESQNIRIDTVTSETLGSFPLTSKADIEACNDDFQGAHDDRIVDIVMSSGTTGKPTRILYTDSDLQRLAYNEETSLRSCGLTAADKVLLTCTIDRCFIAGLAYFSGLRNIGAAAIRNGQNTLESHTEVIRRLQPTAIIGVPSFLKKLGEFISKEDRGLVAPIKKLICIGEPIRDRKLENLDIAGRLETEWQAHLYSTYASSETITSFCECSAGAGGHLLADLAMVEIVDDHGKVSPPGQTGEIVVTPLGITGMPLIRFKTGDISFLVDESCSCGRYTPRLGPILGRKAQMLKIRGTTLYPQSIVSVMEGIEDITDFYIQCTKENELSDLVTIHAATDSDRLTAADIEKRLQASLRVKPKVVIESGAEVRQQIFNPSYRKPVRFFDKRNQ